MRGNGAEYVTVRNYMITIRMMITKGRGMGPADARGWGSG